MTSYNDLQFAISELSTSGSGNDELNGSLKRFAAIRTIRDTVYDAITSTSVRPRGT